MFCCKKLKKKIKLIKKRSLQRSVSTKTRAKNTVRNPFPITLHQKTVTACDTKSMPSRSSLVFSLKSQKARSPEILAPEVLKIDGMCSLPSPRRRHGFRDRDDVSKTAGKREDITRTKEYRTGFQGDAGSRDTYWNSPSGAFFAVVRKFYIVIIYGVGCRERDRDRDRETQRETDRQRQTDRQRRRQRENSNTKD